jgi:hypothetical protein
MAASTVWSASKGLAASKALRAALMSSVAATLVAPSMAQNAETPLDRYIRQAETAYSDGKFVLAEKTWRRALAAAKKSGDDAKTVSAMVGVGKSLVKEEKFPLAQDIFQQALDIDKEKSLDPAAVNTEMTGLAAVYKPIDWSKARADVSKFLNDVGIQTAYGTRSAANATTHVKASLAKKWQKSTDDLYKEYGPPSRQSSEGGSAGAGTTDTGTTGSADANTTALVGSGENPVKKIRLDKTIEFDIVRDNGKYRVMNIKGISANVGLWVKIADIALDVDEQNNPYAQVRAGTMGISKTEKVKMPLDAYNQLKDGVDQVDPFMSVTTKSPGDGSTPSGTSSVPPDTSTIAPESPVPSP